MANYKQQGIRARANNEPRESCRYKAEDIVQQWCAGWDEENKRLLDIRHGRAVVDAVLRWEDVTSYAQGERGNIPPKTWSLRCSRLVGVGLTVTRNRDIAGWVIRITGLSADSDTHEIDNVPASEAKVKGLARLRRLLAERITALNGVVPVLDERPDDPKGEAWERKAALS